MLYILKLILYIFVIYHRVSFLIPLNLVFLHGVELVDHLLLGLCFNLHFISSRKIHLSPKCSPLPLLKFIFLACGVMGVGYLIRCNLISTLLRYNLENMCYVDLMCTLVLLVHMLNFVCDHVLIHHLDIIWAT